tara:strand:+ start:272 stop:736 length:465 start_codon:yes stop_codon:yes gene_type:complete
MQGTVIHIHEGGGIITGDNQERYTFSHSEIKGNMHQMNIGARIDFIVSDNAFEKQAKEIYPLMTSNLPNMSKNEKDKLIACLLAIFLGGLGIHKFYLGYEKQGITMLLLGTIGWLLIIPALINALIALVEGIIYITKSDEEFEQIYVQNQKPWF